MLQGNVEAEIKQAGNKTHELQTESLILVGEVLKKIHRLLWDRKKLKNELKIDSHEPAKVEISVNDQVVYKGLKGEAPTVNTLDPFDAEYIQQAISTQPGQTIGSRNLTIKINGRTVLEVENGLVKTNELDPLGQHQRRRNEMQIAFTDPKTPATLTPLQRYSDLRNAVALQTAKECLQYGGQINADGTKTYEMDSYQFKQNSEGIITIQHRDRGTILTTENGTPQGNITESDRAFFEAIPRQLEQFSPLNEPSENRHQTVNKTEVELSV